TLAFEFQVISGAGQVIHVVVQALVEASPKPRVPVPLKAKVPLVRELEHRAMCIRLEVQSEREVEPPCPKVEPSDVPAAPLLAEKRVENVIKIDVEVVILKRPAVPALALHIIQNRIKTVTTNQPALEIEARDRRCLGREFLQRLKADRLPA